MQAEICESISASVRVTVTSDVSAALSAHMEAVNASVEASAAGAAATLSAVDGSGAPACLKGYIGKSVDPAEATASEADVLLGKTFLSGTSRLKTGTIPSLGAATFTPGASPQTIEAGQYLAGAQTIGAIPSNYGLIAWNGATLSVT